MEKNQNIETDNHLIDISYLAFIYSNVVSFINAVCLDMDVIGKLNYFKEVGKVTDEKKELFHFIQRRTYLSLIVTLDAIIDDPNADKEDGEKVKNNGVNLIKLLNLVFDAVRSNPNKIEKKRNIQYVEKLMEMHKKLQNMEERKNLGTFRDRLAAHVDTAFIKEQKYEEFDMGNEQFIKIMIPVLNILNGIKELINVTDGEPLVEIKPFDPERQTPINHLF